MADTRLLPGFVLVATATIGVAAALLAIGWTRPAGSRAGLIAGGLPLALLPPVAAAAFIAAMVGGYFGGQTDFGPSGRLAAMAASLWELQRFAWGAFAAACLLGLALGLVRCGPAAGESCSVRRGFALLLLPCLGLLAATPVTHRVAKGVRVGVIALSSDFSDPESRARSDAALVAAGFPMDQSGALGSIARFLTLTTLVGVFGGLTAVIVLLGLAVPGFILAWGVRFGTVFGVLASALWLIAAGLGILAALGALAPLRFH